MSGAVANNPVFRFGGAWGVSWLDCPGGYHKQVRFAKKFCPTSALCAAAQNWNRLSYKLSLSFSTFTPKEGEQGNVRR